MKITQLDEAISSTNETVMLLGGKIEEHRNETDEIVSLNDEMGRNINQAISVVSDISSDVNILNSSLDRCSAADICNPPHSCMEILQQNPDSPSGYYWIKSQSDNRLGAVNMYCDMERSCNGVGGGWMRVGFIHMTDPSNTCPLGLMNITEDSHRLCTTEFHTGCSSTLFSVLGIQYSQVCGKIIGYQQKTPDGFRPFSNSQDTIDHSYVDGISLTHGSNPREHIWTFVVALHEHSDFADAVCPCTDTRPTDDPAVPSFVGQDYFCDTGSEDRFENIFIDDDPLWDGAGCGQYNDCCSFNSPPWFLKEITPPTTDDIEMRLCRDQVKSDEDITFETLELYVQ